MKRKVKKFGSGGDIITGLGAVLVGKALYDKYKEGKGSDKDDDYTRRVKEYGTAKAKVSPPFKDPDVEVPAANKDEVREAGRQRALDQSKDPRANYMPEGADRKVLYSDVNAKRTDDAPVVKKKKDASAYTGQGMAGSDKGGKKKAGADKAPAFTGTGMAGSDTGKKEPPVLKAGESKVVGEGELKPYPEAEAKARKAADRQKFLQRRVTTAGDPNKKEPTSAGFKRIQSAVQGTLDNATRSTVRSDADKMRERALEVERRRKKEEGKKAGGAVKKYASGGSVMASKMGSVKTAKPSMRSASSRADGIAIRGKTRA